MNIEKKDDWVVVESEGQVFQFKPLPEFEETIKKKPMEWRNDFLPEHIEFHEINPEKDENTFFFIRR